MAIKQMVQVFGTTKRALLKVIPRPKIHAKMITSNLGKMNLAGEITTVKAVVTTSAIMSDTTNNSSHITVADLNMVDLKMIG